MKRFKVIFKFSNKLEKKLTQINLLFIFVFLNLWDFVVNRLVFNAMVLGLIMFAPSAFLWFIGTLRSLALIVLISIFEFMVMLVFIAEGFELGGISSTLKSIFWLPYLVMAAVNGFWALKIYSERENPVLQERG